MKLLPRGTLAVGAGLAGLGIGSYAHLGIAGHALDDAGLSTLSVLWSISLVASQGLFLPIEQEITRLVAGRVARGEGLGPAVRRSLVLASTVLGALLLALALLSGPVADRLFGGSTAIVGLLGASVAGYAAAHVVRGVLAGRGHLGWYGTQLGLDGLLRLLVAGALGLAGSSSVAAFAAVLVVAPVVSTALTLGPAIRPTGPGPLLPWGTLVRGLGLLTVSALMAQLVVNMPVVNARLLAPGDAALAGALLSALVLVRIPIFLFASLQAALLPGLSTAVAAADPGTYRRLLGRALLVVTVLAGGGGLVAVAVGPWLVRTLFDAPDVLGHRDFVLLAAGTLAYLWALVLGQGVLAQNRHRDLALGWVVGGAVLAVVTLLPGGVAVRVELGYAAGAFAVAAALAVALRIRAVAPVAIGASR